MTRSRIVAPLFLAFLALAACGKKAEEGGVVAPTQPVAAVPPPAGSDWTETVAKTPEGGFRLGNPNAPVKLVEYGAFSCPHCRDFTAEAAEPLRADFIKSGKVSYEFRPFFLGPLDVPASLLTQCQGPAPYFKMAEQLFAAQEEWVGKVVALSREEQAKIQALPMAAQPAAFSKAMDLDGFFRQRGLPQAKIDACLADKTALADLTALQTRATEQDKVTGTPSFFINGAFVSGVTWPELAAKLRTATGG
ncbi:thioredoxin domain-containing protein [Sphingomonas naphthae]|uniref:Thioredoxin domain-containing protein n=1 Tax=Sphingomonas naphthae TaxID=1813468 RepID=A0ABY7TSY0_9SPHN|nr:thioredoxin domain-containing protein [Sphingomonas naphthae]WCT75329.1 thioredoxin domain-containing protein [Sphingomonas naphthae]